MANFKAMKTVEVSESMGFTKILKDGCDVQLISYYLKDGKATVFRMLPSFDENGHEELALNPEGHPKAIETSLGQCFYVAEVASIIKNGRYTFITNVLPYDREGNPVNNYKSPYMTFSRVVGYKLWEQENKRNKGHVTDVPEHWLSWEVRKVLPHPQSTYFAQCMVKELNGEIRKDMKGNPEWITPAVISIPRSAETVFIQQILAKDDPDQPLSTTNNTFGDFCSCANGRLLRLNKFKQASNKNADGGTTYKLSPSQVLPLDPADAVQMVRPWDDIMVTPTVEDQMEILCNIFEPATIDLAFRRTGYYKYVPAAIKGAAKGIAEAIDAPQVKALGYVTGAQPVKAPVSQQAKPPVPQTVTPPVQQPAKPAFKPAGVSSGVSPVIEEAGPVLDDDNALDGLPMPSDTETSQFQAHLKALMAKKGIPSK
jgi:hypothetical protein